MAKVFYKGMVPASVLERGTEKAFYVELNDGKWISHARPRMWIARKLCEIGEVNDVGWCEIIIPRWLFINNQVAYGRVLDINWTDVLTRE